MYSHTGPLDNKRPAIEIDRKVKYGKQLFALKCAGFSNFKLVNVTIKIRAVNPHRR